jgi:hypothetical protein
MRPKKYALPALIADTAFFKPLNLYFSNARNHLAWWLQITKKIGASQSQQITLMLPINALFPNSVQAQFQPTTAL